MDKQKLELITQLAEKAREWAEKEQEKNPKSFKKNLTGLCAKANSYLFSLLKENQIESHIVINNYHCFLLYEGYVIDVTATQFGEKRILIEEYPNMNYWAYKKELVFSSVEALLKYQKKSGWKSEQFAIYGSQAFG